MPDVRLVAEAFTEYMNSSNLALLLRSSETIWIEHSDRKGAHKC